MRAGRLNRRATFQTKTASRDADYGSEVITWTDFATVWADLNDAIAAERIDNSVRVLTQRSTLTVRYLAGVTTDMRVVMDDGRTFQIVSIAETRKKVGLTLLVEQYSA